jgi:hypothetical protein
MSTLHIELKCKFRAFLITFGTINKTWDFTIPAPVPVQTLLQFSDRGVNLLVQVQ